MCTCWRKPSSSRHTQAGLRAAGVSLLGYCPGDVDGGVSANVCRSRDAGWQNSSGFDAGRMSGSREDCEMNVDQTNAMFNEVCGRAIPKIFLEMSF